MITSTEEAIAIVKDSRLPERQREDAVHYLREYPTPEGMEALVAALSEDNGGVRWACSEALAQLGEQALPALLRALSRSAEDSLLREGALHVLRRNVSPRVRRQARELIAALRGPAASVAAMEAAHRLLAEIA